MDKPRQRKKLSTYFCLHCIREVITFALSIIFWVYFAIACILIIGSLFNLSHELVLIIRTLLNIEQDTMFETFNLLLKFIIFDAIVFSLFLLIRKRIYKKEGINHGKVF